MKFFKLYMGDYQRDTAHLSITEHGAYLLMLQHYYATEKALPVDKALHRMLRAQDRIEREAIDTIAAQFWTRTEDGLVNNRAADEIMKASTQAGTNRITAIAREASRREAREKHEQSTIRATIRSTKPAPRARGQTPDSRLEDSEPDGSAVLAKLLTAKERPKERLWAFGATTPLPDTNQASHGAAIGLREASVDRIGNAWTDADVVPAKPLTAKERLWALGVPLLGDGARGLLGKLAKAHGEELLAKVLAEATLERPVDAKAWVIAACEAKAKAKPTNGHAGGFSGGGRELLDHDSREPWAIKAGFEDTWAALNAGCYEHNAAKFRNGQRLQA